MNILVKYYNQRMLWLTVDKYSLLRTIFKTYGDGTVISFEEMNEHERKMCSKSFEPSPSDDLKITKLYEVFWIMDNNTGEVIRRKDLEENAIRYGQK